MNEVPAPGPAYWAPGEHLTGRPFLHMPPRLPTSVLLLTPFPLPACLSLPGGLRAQILSTSEGPARFPLPSAL